MDSGLAAARVALVLGPAARVVIDRFSRTVACISTAVARTALSLTLWQQGAGRANLMTGNLVAIMPCRPVFSALAAEEQHLTANSVPSLNGPQVPILASTTSGIIPLTGASRSRA